MSLLFFGKTLAQGLTGVELEVAGYTAEVEWHEPRAGGYERLTAFMTDPITAGTVTVQARKNGSAEGSPVVLAAGKHRGTESLVVGRLPGDRTTCIVTTSSDLAPVAGDLLVVVE